MGSKRRAKQSKPRLRSVSFDLGEPKRLTEIRIDRAGRLTLVGEDGTVEPIASTAELSYARPKRPKVIARANVGPGTPPLHPDSAIETADRIFIVDTSSRDVGTERLHATAVLIAQPIGERDGQTLIGWQRHVGFEFRGVVDRPEAFAWCELIERLRRTIDGRGFRRVCIVVDSHLGELEKMNSREAPIWREYMLPPAFEILYASADAGGSVLSAWMRECDKESVKLSRKIESATSAPELLETSLVGGPQLRVWRPVD